MEIDKQQSVKSIEENNQTLFKLKEDLKKFINLNSKNYTSLYEQLKEFLAFGNQLTDFTVGIVSHIEGQVYTIVQTVCEGNILQKGDVFDLNDTICKVIVGCHQSRIYDKIKGSDVEHVTAVVNLELQSYIGCPVIVDNKIYGTLNFSKKTEIEDLEKFRHSFFIIEIMAQIVGVLIAKDQQHHMVNELNLSLKKIIKNLEAKNRQLEEFTYIAAHDLQEPLRNVKNMAGLISKDASNVNTIMRQSINYLTTATERMSSLVEGLMVYAKIGSNEKLIEINCNKIVEQVLEYLQLQIKQSKANIKCDNLPIIKGYELETRLLFQNLIGNAIKYRKPDVVPEIEISCEEESEYYLFKITDNGVGIEKEYWNKIFKIFQKGHKKRETGSTGIGLAHCIKIVELYKGEIWLESEIGLGSTFFVQLQKL